MSSIEPASRLTPNDHQRLHAEIQRILADDVPYFWLIDSLPLRAHRTTFRGFRLWTGAFVEAVAPAAETP